MILLRFYLLFGLIAHKVIWEQLRPAKNDTPPEKSSFKLLLIKAVKIAILVAIIVQTMIPEILPILSEPFVLRVVGTTIYTIGLVTAIAARIQLGKNWSNIETGQVLDDQEVVSKGIYGLIRHPIYTGDLLLLLGLQLSLNSWLFLGVFLLAPVVMLKAIREEQMLAEELTGYESYRAKTKRFIPYLI